MRTFILGIAFFIRACSLVRSAPLKSPVEDRDETGLDYVFGEQERGNSMERAELVERVFQAIDPEQFNFERITEENFLILPHESRPTGRKVGSKGRHIEALVAMLRGEDELAQMAVWRRVKDWLVRTGRLIKHKVHKFFELSNIFF